MTLFKSFESFKSVGSVVSAFSALCFLSLLSALSIGSIGSFASVASVLSIASTGSLLSVGSYRSFLSIGCVDAYLSVCGRHTDGPAATDRHLPDDTLVLVEIKHDKTHTSYLDNVDNVAECNNRVVITNAGDVSVDITGWRLFKFKNEDEQLFDTESMHTFDDQTIIVNDNTTSIGTVGAVIKPAGPIGVWCTDDANIKKDDVIILVDPDNIRRSTAQIPKFYSWDRPAQHYLRVADITITIEDKTWKVMAECTLAEKLSDDPPDRCDYQEATCAINWGNPVPCEVKRKGHSTWRSMDDSPSVNVKMDPKTDSDHPHQRKLTFNNMALDDTDGAEIISYSVFAAFGVPSPRAMHTTVRLQHAGAQLALPKTYASIEHPNTAEFLAANNLDGYAMFEYELSKSEQKQGFEGYDLKAELTDVMYSKDLKAIWGVVDKMAMFRYYAAEVATGNVDGFCRRYRERDFLHNTYVLRSPGGVYSFVPWSLDNTNACFVQTAGYVGPFNMGSIFSKQQLPRTVASCGVMQTCFENKECAADYLRVSEDIAQSTGIDLAPCEVKGSFWRLTSTILYLGLIFTMLVGIVYLSFSAALSPYRKLSIAF
jgi:hypothetical protein